MTDLFIHADERQLRARWDYCTAVFDIVAREYAAVLAGDRPHGRHRTILQQCVSDLIDLRADLARMGGPPPFDPGPVWAAAVEWVTALRRWRFPPDHLPSSEVERELLARKGLEERFNREVVAAGTAGVVADACAVITAGGPRPSL